MTIIAVLSDIHGNVYALQAVLDDAKKRGAGLFINLGDIFYGPIAPRATYDLLLEYDAVTICGNQDRQIYAATEKDIQSNPTLQFVLEDIGDAPLSWLRSLPFDDHLPNDIYMCHGTPADDRQYLLEDVTTGQPVIRDDHEIMSLLDGISSKLVLCGHSHIPRTVLTDSGQLIVNPGSVGLPAYMDNEPVPHAMENHAPHACYTIIEERETGWIVQHTAVPYDHHRAAYEAEKRNRSDWAQYLTSGRKL
ncbi:metallophosphoesterase family protein [Desulfolithobacter sp.]